MLKHDKTLTLSSDTFSAMKDDFDSILNRTLGNMEMKGADEATVTLKLGIKLERTTIYNDRGAKDVIEPSFRHDISSMMQVKDKKSGQLAKEMALIFDKESGAYILRPFSDGQMSFDEEGTIYNGDGEILDTDELELPFGETMQIEMKEEPETDLFSWLEKYVGKELFVRENMGNYSIRDEDGNLVMSSAVSSDNMIYIDENILADYVDCVLSCEEYQEDDGLTTSIVIAVMYENGDLNPIYTVESKKAA